MPFKDFALFFALMTAAFSSVVLPGCAENGPGAKTATFTRISEDVSLDESHAAAAGVSAEALQKLIDRAIETDSDTLFVYQNGTPLFVKRWKTHATPTSIQSITKSLTSLVIGKLIETGKIRAVNEKLSEFFPELSADEAAGSAITIRQLLAQTSGIEDPAEFWLSPDLLKESLKLAGAASREPPQLSFRYSNAGTLLLGEVIRRASGKGFFENFKSSFAIPLGLSTDATIARDAQGFEQTAGGMYLRPDDLVQIGELLRNEGAYRGTSLVSSDYVHVATRMYQWTPPGYGYLFWLSSARDTDGELSRGYEALGWMGQHIAVIPEKGLVIVRTRVPADWADSAQNAKNGLHDLLELATEL